PYPSTTARIPCLPSASARLRWRCERSGAGSLGGPHRKPGESPETIGQDLDAQAEQDEGRETQQDVGAGFTEQPQRALGEAVAEIDPRRYSQCRRQCADAEREQLVSRGAPVAKGDGDRNRAGADGERHREREEGVAEHRLIADVRLRLPALGIVT